MEKGSEKNEKRTKTGEPQSESAQRNSADKAAGKPTQMHENRENPDADHVPGHKGYNRHEHQDNVNPTRREP